MNQLAALRSLLLGACTGGLLALGAPAAVAQVQPGDVGVVTSDGFYLLAAATPQAPPAVFAPVSAFGLPNLELPGIAWVPGSNDFVVSSSLFLFHVRVQAAGGTLITDITPANGGVMRRPDIHPGTGELLLHDTQGLRALRFAPPFAAGMVENLNVPLPAAVRALSHDIRSLPPGVTYATSTEIVRLAYDNTLQTIALTGASGIDDVPQYATQTVFARFMGDAVGRTTGSPNLVQDLNVVGNNPFTSCSPVVLSPRNVVFNTDDFRILVFAEGGVNPACVPGVSGPNHVVSLPPAIGVPVKLLTSPADSGITGTHGDLALVHDDFAFVAPWGLGCGVGDTPTLDAADNLVPLSPLPGFGLEVRDAPASASIWMLAGVNAIAATLPAGCTVLVNALFAPIFVGNANGSGELDLSVPIPAGVPPGTILRLQAAFSSAGPLDLSNGLLLHIAP